MDARHPTDWIFAARHPFRVEIVRDDRQLHEAFRVRYQVYCLERGYEPGRNGEETDEYDSRARHALLRTLDDGRAVGTIRLIGPDRANPQSSFPIQRLIDPALLGRVPLLRTGEMSRMAIPKQNRRVDIDPVLLRMALWRAVVQMSSEMSLTHWLAVIEPSSIRLHARSGIFFDALGPLVVHHGLRQPMVGDIRKVLENLRAERPLLWAYLTNHGEWYQPADGALVAAA